MEINTPNDEFRERLMSMQELEPSPIKDTPVDTAKGEYFPKTSSTPPNAPASLSSSLGLSGSHNAIWWLTRIQRYSSYTFTAFLTAHITNNSIIPLLTRSLQTSDTYLLLTRPYYQSPLFEPLLVVAPLVLHIGSGVALRIYRRRQSLKWYGAEDKADRRKLAWPKLSGTSMLGYSLVPLVAGHTFVNRILPLWVEGGSSSVGLQYVAHGFAKHPAVAFGGYAALVGIASWHVVWGWAQYMGWTPEKAVGGDAVEKGFRRKQRLYGINGLAAVLAGLWMAGGLGVVGRGGAMGGWMGRAYDELYGKIPIIGNWM